MSSTSSSSSYCFLSFVKCLPSTPPPPSSFLCPSCSRPNFSFFEIDEINRVIDKRVASVLLCAARIVSAVMDKALNVAKAKMKTCVREAAAARKRVRDELERSATLLNIKRVERSVQVSGAGNNPGEDKAEKLCTREGQMKSQVSVYESPEENRAAAFVHDRDRCIHSTGNPDPGHHEKLKKSNGELEQTQTNDSRVHDATLEQA